MRSDLREKCARPFTPSALPGLHNPAARKQPSRLGRSLCLLLCVCACVCACACVCVCLLVCLLCAWSVVARFLVHLPITKNRRRVGRPFGPWTSTLSSRRRIPSSCTSFWRRLARARLVPCTRYAQRNNKHPGKTCTSEIPDVCLSHAYQAKNKANGSIVAIKKMIHNGDTESEV